MKLEVGMYVRTKCGIEQIYRIDNNKTKWKYVYKLKEQDGDGCINIGILSSEDILKASHNIIDLIQENDFVNGEKVSSIQYEGMGFEHIKCVQTICKFDSLDNQFYTETYFNENIKSTVTKEQFEAMAYKVGDSNE